MEIKFEKVSLEDSLKNLNFTIPSNTITSFIGKKGSGKSTVLELISGLKFPSTGVIKIDNTDINKKSITILRPEIGYVYQNPLKQFFMNTVKEELEFALKNYEFNNIDQRVKDSLKMVGLNDSYLNISPFKLSEGEQRKIAIASILAFNPKIIVLDEPTLGLDGKSRRQLIKLIKMMKFRYNKTIIIASSDTDMILEVSDNVYIINKGKIVKKDEKYNIFSDYELLNKYDIKVPKIAYFTHLAKEKGIKMGLRDDINDLIKDVYRYVK